MGSDPDVLDRRGAAPGKGRGLRLAAAVLVLCTGGCAYLKDRGLDLTDLVDLKYAFAAGILAKAEATEYLGLGLGFGATWRSREWYGRRFVTTSGDMYSHLLLVGAEDIDPCVGTEYLTRNLLVFSLRDIHPPLISRFRFGGEIILPGFLFGLYANLGEAADFILGFSSVDLAGDDGLPKWPPLPREQDGGLFFDSCDYALDFMRSPRAADRWNGVTAVRRYAYAPETARALIRALKDPNAAVRANAADGLAQYRATEAVGPLIDALPDGDGGARVSIARALRTITGMPLSYDPAKWRAWWEGRTEKHE